MILNKWLDRLRGIVYVKKQLAKQQQISVEFKKDIFKTYMDTVVRGKVDEDKKQLDLIGYKLNFCEFGHYAYLLEELYINQEYAFNDVREKPFIIDCGSNIGMSIIYFKHIYPGCEIIAFEPDEDAHACLEKNVRENNFSDVSIHKKALSKDGGEIAFYLEDDGAGSLTSSAYGSDSSRKVVIDSVKLSDYIDREVDILKMDIEGAETEVLEELSEKNLLGNVRQMSIEYHHHCYDDKDVMSNILSTLESNGFGYQVEGKVNRPFERNMAQGMIIYAYRKDQQV